MADACQQSEKQTAWCQSSWSVAKGSRPRLATTCPPDVRAGIDVRFLGSKREFGGGALDVALGSGHDDAHTNLNVLC